MDIPVRIWEEWLSIPTYGTGEPGRNPAFLEERVYQGSSGEVYPYPLIERILDRCETIPHHAVFLENRYLKVMVLPGLGGRVQMAVDKTNGYDFIYHNHVIKPALVGLTGPWISGGIEFNWPQHHRPSTFEPLAWTLEESPDGSRTLWCGEIERMSRMKGLVGYRLRPNKAVLEVVVRMQNRMPYPQPFLWWANPAVHANDSYQSVFPPDVTAVFDHGRRDVSSFPIARGHYYKVDYSAGVDISRWRNIPVPTSYMAAHSDCDFLGGYDHGKRAGMLHVADHHLSPGKKQWVWGKSEFGRAWERNLTDADGPYIELMAGVYTDNQPDFAWLQPFDTKTFTQYFLPYKELGMVRNASRDFVLGLEMAGSRAEAWVYATGHEPRVRIHLMAGSRELGHWVQDLDPVHLFKESVPVPEGIRAEELLLAVQRADGTPALSCHLPRPGAEPDSHPVIQPAAAPPMPEDVSTCEQLFLIGQHLEQYRHATREPMPYYKEALRRDQKDSRCSTALGLLLLKRGRFGEAERRFRAATSALTRWNANPAQGESHFHLGHCLLLLGREREAYDVLSKAAWCAAVKGAAHTLLAQLDARRGRLAEALQHLENALGASGLNDLARGLRIPILRHLGRLEEAQAEAERLAAEDPLDPTAAFEQSLLARSPEASGLYWRNLERLAGGRIPALIEAALPYAACGFESEALHLLGLAEGAKGADAGLVPYYQAWLSRGAGDAAVAGHLKQARRRGMEGCFPHRIEDFLVLKWALRQDPSDGGAAYALGNWLYSRRERKRARRCWVIALRHDSGSAVAWRNLGLAEWNGRWRKEKALRCYREAFRLAPADGRILFELDQVEKLIGLPPAERLERLERHKALVDTRDELSLERAVLLNRVGRSKEALALLCGRTFHPWEGAEGKATRAYTTTCLALAREAIAAGQLEAAQALVDRALDLPESLGEGRLEGCVDSDAHFLAGLLLRAMGNPSAATLCFLKGAEGRMQVAGTDYYNDQPAEKAFYAAMCRFALDGSTKAFEEMAAFAETYQGEPEASNYFAVSRPDLLGLASDRSRNVELRLRFVRGLARLGLGRAEEAAAAFHSVLVLDPSHLPAHDLLRQLGTAFWNRFVCLHAECRPPDQNPNPKRREP